MRSERGAVSLLTALLVPAILLSLLTVFRAAVRARNDLFLARAAAAAVEAELASFSRDLSRDFGLFAAPMDGTKAATAAHLIGGGNIEAGVISPFRPLSDEMHLVSEIVRHMKIRAPLHLAEDLLKRHMKTTDGGYLDLHGSSLAGQMKLLADSINIVRPEALGIGGDNLDGKRKGLLEELIDAKITSMYESIMVSLMPVQLFEPGNNLDVDFFDPDKLSQLGGAFDSLFVIPDAGVYDRFLVAEYALSYFHNAAPSLYAAFGVLPMRTPDGREIASFPASRHYEVEQIIMGKSAQPACTAVYNTIYAFRTLIHLAKLLGDGKKRLEYLSTATTVTGAISAISLGAVNIPPEALVYLYMLWDALDLGKGDAIRLQKGFPVAFWPGASEVNVYLYYPDYLRMMLLLQDPATLAGRIEGQIKKVCPGDFYTKVEVSFSKNGREVKREGGYRGRE
jgi:hypothetical protein